MERGNKPKEVKTSDTLLVFGTTLLHNQHVLARGLHLSHDGDERVRVGLAIKLF